jgi:hypothetical protein
MNFPHTGIACIPCANKEHADDGTGEVCPCCGVFVPAARDCDAEFGPHEHDDVECARILADMSPDYDDWEARALNREAEENMLGRPLFPNEY